MGHDPNPRGFEELLFERWAVMFCLVRQKKNSWYGPSINWFGCHPSRIYQDTDYLMLQVRYLLQVPSPVGITKSAANPNLSL